MLILLYSSHTNTISVTTSNITFKMSLYSHFECLETLLNIYIFLFDPEVLFSD